jgi:hypothetical protein
MENWKSSYPQSKVWAGEFVPVSWPRFDLPPAAAGLVFCIHLATPEKGAPRAGVYLAMAFTRPSFPSYLPSLRGDGIFVSCLISSSPLDARTSQKPSETLSLFEILKYTGLARSVDIEARADFGVCVCMPMKKKLHECLIDAAGTRLTRGCTVPVVAFPGWLVKSFDGKFSRPWLWTCQRKRPWTIGRTIVRVFFFGKCCWNFRFSGGFVDQALLTMLMKE